jgi:membrane-bound lytic murein transglycosylase D
MDRFARSSWLLAALPVAAAASSAPPAGCRQNGVEPVAVGTPSIPENVPVKVAPAPAPLSPEAAQELAALVPLSAPGLEEWPEPDLITRDLLERVRTGMALGDYKQARIDREADWFASQPEYIERTFSRAAPYLQYIVNEVEARGMPMELALLPVIESAFQPYAYSRARATGLWQFMSATGGRFGLKQDWW